MRTIRIKTIGLIIGGLFIVGVFLHFIGILGFTTSLIQSGLYKVAGPFYELGAKITSASTARKAECESVLEAQIEQLIIDNAKLKTLIAENSALKSALDFQEAEIDRPVLARVISESPDVTFRGLVINKGSVDGVAIGQPVIAGDGIIIGKIKTVNKKSATVLLLIDSLSKLAVSIQGGSSTVGVLDGNRGLSMSISLIPQSERIVAGDVVITSGLEPLVRRGLVVGVVEKVHKDSQEPFQTAIVSPFSGAEHPVFVQVLVSTLDSEASDDELIQ